RTGPASLAGGERAAEHREGTGVHVGEVGVDVAAGPIAVEGMAGGGVAGGSELGPEAIAAGKGGFASERGRHGDEYARISRIGNVCLTRWDGRHTFTIEQLKNTKACEREE